MECKPCCRLPFLLAWQGSAELPGRGYALVSFSGDIERVSAFDLTAMPSVTPEVRSGSNIS